MLRWKTVPNTAKNNQNIQNGEPRVPLEDIPPYYAV